MRNYIISIACFNVFFAQACQNNTPCLRPIMDEFVKRNIKQEEKRYECITTIAVDNKKAPSSPILSAQNIQTTALEQQDSSQSITLECPLWPACKTKNTHPRYRKFVNEKSLGAHLRRWHHKEYKEKKTDLFNKAKNHSQLSSEPNNDSNNEIVNADPTHSPQYKKYRQEVHPNKLFKLTDSFICEEEEIDNLKISCSSNKDFLILSTDQ